MNSTIEIGNIEFDINEVKSIFCKSVKKVDNSKYRPGHRIENIYGWFWTYLEEKYGKMPYTIVMKLNNHFDPNGYIFGKLT